VLTYQGTENGVIMMNGFGDEEAVLNWVDGELLFLLKKDLRERGLTVWSASHSAGMPGAKVLYEIVLEEQSSVGMAVRREWRRDS